MDIIISSTIEQRGGAWPFGMWGTAISITIGNCKLTIARPFRQLPAHEIFENFWEVNGKDFIINLARGICDNLKEEVRNSTHDTIYPETIARIFGEHSDEVKWYSNSTYIMTFNLLRGEELKRRKLIKWKSNISQVRY